MDVVTVAAHEPPGHVTAARTETKRPHDAGRMQTGVHNGPGVRCRTSCRVVRGAGGGGERGTGPWPLIGTMPPP